MNEEIMVPQKFDLSIGPFQWERHVPRIPSPQDDL